jgi:Glycosyltransferase family 87
LRISPSTLSKIGLTIGVIGILLVIIISCSKQLRRQDSRGDVEVYQHAARLVLNGGDIYTEPTERGKLYYLYLPLFAVLMTPLAGLNITSLIYLWAIFNIFLVGWIILAFYQAMTGESFFSLPLKSKWFVGFFSLLLSIRAVLYHIDLAQANILILAVAVFGLKLLARKKEIGAGVAVGISIVLKIITLPLTVLFAARRETRLVAGVLIGVAAGVLLPSLIFGFERNLLYDDYWLRNVVFSNDITASYHWGFKFNFSPEAQLFRFFSNVPAFENKNGEFYLTIFELPKQTIQLLGKAVFALMAALIFFYGARYRKSGELIGKWGGIALCFSLMPIMSPVTQKHYFVMLLPAHIYVVYLWHCLPLKDKWFRVLVVAHFVLMTATTNAVGSILGSVMAGAGGLIWGTLLLSAAIFRAAQCLPEAENCGQTQVAD